MLDHGLRATVNSDDPAYFAGYVNENLVAAQARRRARPATRSSSWRATRSRSLALDDERAPYLAALEAYSSSG